VTMNLRAYLDALYADAPGYVHVCRTGNWVGRGYPTTPDGLDAAAAAVAAVDTADEQGVYIRATTLATLPEAGRRGGAKDSAAALFLVADLDIAGPGHKANDLPPDEASARRIVAESVLPDPTIWVHSGGGLYAIWAFTEPCTDLELAEKLSNDLQEELRRSAATRGWSYGNIGDLARVIRAPDTTNRKPGVHRPCRVLSADGERYTPHALRELVPTPAAAEAPTPPVASSSTAGERGPFAALQDTASWADLWRPAGWTFVRTEHDGAELWRRPDATSEHSARCGHNGVPTAIVWSTDAGLPSGNGQRLTKGRVFAWLWHSGDMAAATADLYAACSGRPASKGALALPAEVLEAVAATAEHRRQTEEEVAAQHLPESFWNARESLRHIRQAAHSRCASADGLLHATLARLAALQHHQTGVDSGMGKASLNYMTVLSGPSGSGKSTVAGIAHELLPVPESIAMNGGFRDSVPVGSGEGLAELYMGQQSVATGETKDGKTTYGKVKAQVRHNALVYVDEGEQLFAMADRKGATIMTAIRSAWNAESLGQSNATAETTRVLERGSYALGMVVGIQPSKVGPLFNEAAGGTPQRFLFCRVTDPHIPNQGPFWPGRLPCTEPVPTVDAAAGIFGERSPVTLEMPEDVKAMLWREQLATRRGEPGSVVAELDSHQRMNQIKVAGLLAILEGRDKVSEDDWELASVVWRVTQAVRSELLMAVRAAEVEAQRVRRLATVETQVAGVMAVRDAEAERLEAIESGSVGVVARKVWRDGEVKRKELTNALKSSHRREYPGGGGALIEVALNRAIEAGFVVEGADGVWRRGPAQPPES
jgi:hypothetical protein